MTRVERTGTGPTAYLSSRCWLYSLIVLCARRRAAVWGRLVRGGTRIVLGEVAPLWIVFLVCSRIFFRVSFKQMALWPWNWTSRVHSIQSFLEYLFLSLLSFVCLLFVFLLKIVNFVQFLTTKRMLYSLPSDDTPSLRGVAVPQGISCCTRDMGSLIGRLSVLRGLWAF